jgi:hypothetical protein
MFEACSSNICSASVFGLDEPAVENFLLHARDFASKILNGKHRHCSRECQAECGMGGAPNEA